MALTTTRGTPVLQVLTPTIGGDVPAAPKFVVTTASGTGFSKLYWGMRSADYSSAASASLFSEAEACTLGTGTTTGADASASGGQRVTKALTTSYATVLSLTDPTHVGAYRVLARTKSSMDGVSVRAIWRRSALASQVTNDPTLTDYAANWQIIDLGMVLPDKPIKGDRGWVLSIEAKAPSGTPTLQVDYIVLLPVEQSGQATFTTTVGTSSEGVEISDESVLYEATSTRGGGTVHDWTPPFVYEGDYLTLPSGRVAELIAVGTGTTIDPSSMTLAGALTLSPRYL